MCYRSFKASTLEFRYKKLRFAVAIIGLLLSTNITAQRAEYSSPENQVLVDEAASISLDSITLKGVVLTRAEDPLIGAVVMVEARKVGEITDLDGNFSLKVSHLEVIKVMYSGFKSIEIPVRQLIADNQSGQLRIVLEQESIIVREQVASCAILANPICDCHSLRGRLKLINIITDSRLQEASIPVEEIYKSNLHEVELFPNPIDDIIGVKFNASVPTTVTARLFDVEGELLQVWAPRDLEAGRQEKRFSVSRLQLVPGRYYFVMEVQSGMMETRVVIVGR